MTVVLVSARLIAVSGFGLLADLKFPCWGDWAHSALHMSLI